LPGRLCPADGRPRRPLPAPGARVASHSQDTSPRCCDCRVSAGRALQLRPPRWKRRLCGVDASRRRHVTCGTASVWRPHPVPSEFRQREGASAVTTARTPMAAESGTFSLGGDLTVHRLSFGTMRLTGPGIWGPPPDRSEALAVLRRAVALGINLIDTADSYGPFVSEELIAEALFPYPAGVVIATKGGYLRPGPNQW